MVQPAVFQGDYPQFTLPFLPEELTITAPAGLEYAIEIADRTTHPKKRLPSDSSAEQRAALQGMCEFISPELSLSYLAKIDRIIERNNIDSVNWSFAKEQRRFLMRAAKRAVSLAPVSEIEDLLSQKGGAIFLEQCKPEVNQRIGARLTSSRLKTRSSLKHFQRSLFKDNPLRETKPMALRTQIVKGTLKDVGDLFELNDQEFFAYLKGAQDRGIWDPLMGERCMKCDFTHTSLLSNNEQVSLLYYMTRLSGVHHLPKGYVGVLRQLMSKSLKPSSLIRLVTVCALMGKDEFVNILWEQMESLDANTLTGEEVRRIVHLGVATNNTIPLKIHAMYDRSAKRALRSDNSPYEARMEAVLKELQEVVPGAHMTYQRGVYVNGVEVDFVLDFQGKRCGIECDGFIYHTIHSQSGKYLWIAPMDLLRDKTYQIPMLRISSDMGEVPSVHELHSMLVNLLELDDTRAVLRFYRHSDTTSSIQTPKERSD